MRERLSQPQIFVAHSREDKKIIKKIEDRLSGLEFVSLILLKRPYPEPPAQYFRKIIKECDAVFAIITDNVLKKWYHFAICECLIAYGLEKPIYIFKDKNISNMPAIFNSMGTWEEYDLKSQNGVNRMIDHMMGIVYQMR